MDGLENLARNLGTYTAPTYGMSLQKPTVTYGVFLEDDDNLYSNMKTIFKKKSKATEPASAKPASTKPVTAKVKPVTAKVNPVTAKSASAKNKRAILVRNKTLVREANCAATVGRKNCAVPVGNKTKPTVCSKLDKSELVPYGNCAVREANKVLTKKSTAMELWEEACKIKSTITSNDIKYAGNKFTCYIDDFIWIYVSERNNGGRDLYLRVLSKKVTLRSRNEISKFVF